MLSVNPETPFWMVQNQSLCVIQGIFARLILLLKPLLPGRVSQERVFRKKPLLDTPNGKVLGPTRLTRVALALETGIDAQMETARAQRRLFKPIPCLQSQGCSKMCKLRYSSFVHFGTFFVPHLYCGIHQNYILLQCSGQRQESKPQQCVLENLHVRFKRMGSTTHVSEMRTLQQGKTMSEAKRTFPGDRSVRLKKHPETATLRA